MLGTVKLPRMQRAASWKKSARTSTAKGRNKQVLQAQLFRLSRRRLSQNNDRPKIKSITLKTARILINLPKEAKGMAMFTVETTLAASTLNISLSKTLFQAKLRQTRTCLSMATNLQPGPRKATWAKKNTLCPV